MVLAAAGATSTMAHRVRVRLGLGLGLGFVDIVDMLPAANCGRLRLQPTVTQFDRSCAKVDRRADHGP